MLENWEVYAGGRKILGPLNFTLRRGEIAFLTGPNGSGKSTLLLSIAGAPFLTTRGSLRIFGRDASSMAPEERAALGLYLAFQTLPEIRGVKVSSLLGKEARKLLAFFGFDESFEERELIRLSGGERKILEILQIADKKPKLILLDEPDSGVDRERLEKIKEFLQDYYCQSKEKPTMLIVTHLESLLGVFPWARILELKAGKLKEVKLRKGAENGECE